MDAHCTRRTTRQLERRELRDCSSYTASHWPGKRLRLVDDEPSVEPRLTSESDSKADSDDEDAAYLASPGPAVVAWDSPMPSDCPPNRKKIPQIYCSLNFKAMLPTAVSMDSVRHKLPASKVQGTGRQCPMTR